MIDISKGRYWDLPWSLISGCTPCSPGCERCWAAGIAHHYRRTKAVGQGDKGIPVYTDEKGRFTGKIVTHRERLPIPLKRKKPTVYAVWNDLFHESVPDRFVYESLAYMARSDVARHTFLVLTKRIQRAHDVLSSVKMCEGGWWTHNGAWPHSYAGANPDKVEPGTIISWKHWPPPNMWLIPTVCNQDEADRIVPILLKTPAAHRGLSIEPMLGPVDLTECFTDPASFAVKHLSAFYTTPDGKFDPEGKGHRFTRQVKNPVPIGAVILGGETGPGARPMHPDWVRSVRDQCAAAGVPFFLKSGLGKKKNYFSPEMKEWGNLDLVYSYLEDGEGWPPSIQMHRLLDGRTHDELPWVNKCAS